MKLKLHTFNLPLKHTFTITHESRDIQPTLIVELQDGAYSGFGEATETPYYGVTLAGMIEELESVRTLIETTDISDPTQVWAGFKAKLYGSHPFPLCALDCAVWDLWAKKKNLKLYEAWGLTVTNNPITDYTIGIDTTAKMVEKLKEMPFPLYKIKLGTEYDLDIVKELRKHTDAVFRVDANTGWTADQTIAYSYELKKLNVEFIEQPLKANDWVGMQKVYEKAILPIIADESCILEEDVEKCAGYFHGINIKLMKCGGLTPALRMIEKAKSMNLKVMVGCMTESTIGCSAIAQLLPLLDYVDMDGPLLVHDEISTGITINYGKVQYAADFGTGASLIKKI